MHMLVYRRVYPTQREGYWKGSMVHWIDGVFFGGAVFWWQEFHIEKRSWTGTIKCEQSDDRRDSDSLIVIVHVAEISKNVSQMHHIIFIDHNFSCKDISSYMLHVWNIYLHLPYIYAKRRPTKFSPMERDGNETFSPSWRILAASLMR